MYQPEVATGQLKSDMFIIQTFQLTCLYGFENLNQYK